MSYTTELPPRNLTPEEVEAFQRDGVICVRGLYSPEWVEKITEALEAITSVPSRVYGEKAEVADKRFRIDAFTWASNDRVRDLVLFGPAAHIAQQALGSKRINFFYDQIFVKEPTAPQPTPWHHDYTFWPMSGNDIASVWMSVDAVTPETSALEFIAGSHLWTERFEAVGVHGVVLSQRPLDPVPDVEGGRERFNILSWDLEPGDALLFHALTLHGSRGNSSALVRRRAITTRWCGDDVRYVRTDGHMKLPYDPGLADGEQLSGPVFPQILPHIIEEEVAVRMSGPLTMDPQGVAIARKRAEPAAA